MQKVPTRIWVGAAVIFDTCLIWKKILPLYNILPKEMQPKISKDLNSKLNQAWKIRRQLQRINGKPNWHSPTAIISARSLHYFVLCQQYGCCGIHRSHDAKESVTHIPYYLWCQSEGRNTLWGKKKNPPWYSIHNLFVIDLVKRTVCPSNGKQWLAFIRGITFECLASGLFWVYGCACIYKIRKRVF